MFSRNTYSSAAIIGSLFGAATGAYAYQKTNDIIERVRGKNRNDARDSDFYKIIAAYGLTGAAVSVSLVGLFSGGAALVNRLFTYKPISCDM